MKYLIIHGLNSNPDNGNVRNLTKYFGVDNVIAPTMPNNPVNWMPVLEDVINEIDEELTVIGFSTGGFFAKYISKKYKCPVVLVNPVNNVNDFYLVIGKNKNFYSHEEWDFSEADIDNIRKYDVKSMMGTVGTCYLGGQDEILNSTNTYSSLNSEIEVIIDTNKSHRYILSEDEIADIGKMKYILCG